MRINSVRTVISRSQSLMNNGKGIEDAGCSYASLLQNILQIASVSRTIRCWIQELSLFIARMKQTLHERENYRKLIYITKVNALPILRHFKAMRQ